LAARACHVFSVGLKFPTSDFPLPTSSPPFTLFPPFHFYTSPFTPLLLHPSTFTPFHLSKPAPLHHHHQCGRQCGDRQQEGPGAGGELEVCLGEVGQQQDAPDDQHLPRLDADVEGQELLEQQVLLVGEEEGAEGIGEAQAVDEAKAQGRSVAGPALAVLARPQVVGGRSDDGEGNEQLYRRGGDPHEVEPRHQERQAVAEGEGGDEQQHPPPVCPGVAGAECQQEEQVVERRPVDDVLEAELKIERKRGGHERGICGSEGRAFFFVK